MSDFAAAHAEGQDVSSLVQSCVAQLGGVSGHSLGFIYVTDLLASKSVQIVNALKESSGVETWVGTVGHGICANRTEYFSEPAIAVLTCSLPENAFRIIPQLSDRDNLAKHVDPSFMAGIGIMHGDPRQPATLDLVSGLAQDFGTFLVGGLTSADSQFLQIAGEVGEGSLSGVLIGGQTAVAVGLTQGCSPIGPTHTVTQGQDNILARLDEQSAYGVLCEDLGIADGVDPRPWLSNVHAAVVVSGSDTGDYLVRDLIGIDPERGLVAIGEGIQTGSRVIFVRRDAENADKDLKRMLGELKARAPSPKAGLYHSCLARGPNLFDEPAHELNAIADAFGDIPITGFFGNGEISNNRIYGYTGVLTLFS